MSLTNEQLLHNAVVSNGNTSLIFEQLANREIGTNEAITAAYRFTQATFVALQELKNRSEGVQPPKDG